MTNGIRALAITVVAVVGVSVAASASNHTLTTGPYAGYTSWARMNEKPVYSAPHGQSFVVTYVNSVGVETARTGAFPFPEGTVIVKEAFDAVDCKPGKPGAVFVMQKRARGYDPAANDWHWVRYGDDRALWGEGGSAGTMKFCAACHRSAAVNDYVFGNGTTIKAKPTVPLKPCR